MLLSMLCILSQRRIGKGCCDGRQHGGNAPCICLRGSERRLCADTTLLWMTGLHSGALCLSQSFRGAELQASSAACCIYFVCIATKRLQVSFERTYGHYRTEALVHECETTRRVLAWMSACRSSAYMDGRAYGLGKLYCPVCSYNCCHSRGRLLLNIVHKVARLLDECHAGGPKLTHHPSVLQAT